MRKDRSSKLGLAALLGLMAGMNSDFIPPVKPVKQKVEPLSNKFDDDERAHLEALSQDKTSPGRKAYRQYIKKLKEKYA